MLSEPFPDFPTLDLVVSRFVRKSPSGVSTRANDLQFLQDLFTGYNQTAQGVSHRRFGLPKPQRSRLANHIVVACYKKLIKLQKKMRDLQRAFASHAAALTEELIQYLKNEPDESKSLMGNEYNDFLYGVFDSGESGRFRILDRKIRALDNFADQIVANRYRPVSQERLRKCLQTSVVCIDEETGHASFNAFDNILRNFLDESQTIKRFDAAVAEILDKAKDGKMDCTIIDHLKTSLAVLIDSENENEETVLRASIERILFEQIFVKRPDVLSGENTAAFLDACESVRKMTLEDWKVDKGLVLPEMMTMSWADVINGSQHLKDAAAWINVLQFQICPLDISWCVHLAIKCIGEFVRENRIQMGMLKDQMLSFDETAVLVIPVVAYDPPSNALAIAKFADNMKVRIITPKLSIAIGFYQTAIQYLLDPK